MGPSTGAVSTPAIADHPIRATMLLGALGAVFGHIPLQKNKAVNPGTQATRGCFVRYFPHARCAKAKRRAKVVRPRLKPKPLPPVCISCRSVGSTPSANDSPSDPIEFRAAVVAC